MMDVFKLDLLHDATRRSLENQLQRALSEEEWECIKLTTEHAGIRPHEHYHSAQDVFELIDGLNVSDRVKGHLKDVYSILAEAEAKVHGTTVDMVHFHEVGNAEGISNALLICLAFDLLGAPVVRATAVQVGKGTIDCAHGTMTIPAPATKAILESGIPQCTEHLPGELCTPTSAALIKHFVDEFE